METGDKDIFLATILAVAGIVIAQLTERLDTRQRQILNRWVSGDDTTSVAELYGATVQEVEEVKTCFQSVALQMAASYRVDEGMLRRIVQDFIVLCSHCGSFAYFPCDKFCRECGSQNPLFDESVFHQEVGISLSEMMAEECDQGHPNRDKGYHCPFCGQL